MKQTEIEFFWPLTEQIDLDLDFTACQDYGKRIREYSVPGTPTITTIHFQPTVTSVGHWNVNGPEFRISAQKKPNWIRRMFNKYLIGWEWKDD